jgi:hypothetical protein
MMKALRERHGGYALVFARLDPAQRLSVGVFRTPNRNTTPAQLRALIKGAHTVVLPDAALPALRIMRIVQEVESKARIQIALVSGLVDL